MAKKFAISAFKGGGEWAKANWSLSQDTQEFYDAYREAFV